MIVNEEHEKVVLKRLSEEIHYLKNLNDSKDGQDLWSGRMTPALRKFVKKDESLDVDKISDFRRLGIFISEVPTYQTLSPVYFLSGRHRGQRNMLKERLDALKKEGDVEYLRKYPIDAVGNPFYYKADGLRFSERWSRHVRYIHLTAKYLKNYLQSKKRKILDIGGGYGIYSGLLKKEFGSVISGVVEFPEELLTTYYYLAMNFPEAKINSLREINEVHSIDTAFVEKYDFLLIPIHCYSKIQRGTFDMVVNFNSFGEMSEKWFDYYWNGDALNSAEYLFTVNRFESRPTYETDLNVLSYRLHEYEKIHFKISPLFTQHYTSKYIFFKRAERFTSQCFEFIGRKLKTR